MRLSCVAVAAAVTQPRRVADAAAAAVVAAVPADSVVAVAMPSRVHA